MSQADEYPITQTREPGNQPRVGFEGTISVDIKPARRNEALEDGIEQCERGLRRPDYESGATSLRHERSYVQCVGTARFRPGKVDVRIPATLP